MSSKPSIPVDAPPSEEALNAARILVVDTIKRTYPTSRHAYTLKDAEHEGIKLGEFRIIVEKVSD